MSPTLATCTTTLPLWLPTWATALRTARSSAAFGFQKSRTSTLCEATALATGTGRPAADVVAFAFGLAGAAEGFGAAALVVAGVDAVDSEEDEFAPAASEADEDLEAAASVACLAAAAFCTALPAALLTFAPGSFAGTVVGAGAGAVAVSVAPPGRMNANQAARKTMEPM